MFLFQIRDATAKLHIFMRHGIIGNNALQSGVPAVVVNVWK